LAWYETGIRSFVIRWICPALPCACCNVDTFCYCYSGCVCCYCCCGLENRKREDDMVADPDAAFSLSLPPPRPTPKHFRLLRPTQQSKTLKNLFSHVSTKKHSLIYWIRGGRFALSRIFGNIFRTSDRFFKHNWRMRESVVVFGVCLELLRGTLILSVGNPNGISFTLLLVVHNFSFVDWALLKELQSPFCLLACLLLFQTKNCLGLACLVFLGEF
jgi:hypothetical protein